MHTFSRRHTYHTPPPRPGLFCRSAGSERWFLDANQRRIGPQFPGSSTGEAPSSVQLVAWYKLRIRLLETNNLYLQYILKMFRILRSEQADSRRPGISSKEESAANITQPSADKIPKISFWKYFHGVGGGGGCTSHSFYPVI
jgi:hypothetical protein